MELQRVSFKTAKLLKEKDFNWKTLSRYQDNEDKTVGNALYNHNSVEEQKLWNTGLYSAPEIDLVVKWMREVHNCSILISIYPKQIRIKKNKEMYCGYIVNENWNPTVPLNGSFCKTYEQAQEQAIIECLKLI